MNMENIPVVGSMSPLVLVVVVAILAIVAIVYYRGRDKEDSGNGNNGKGDDEKGDDEKGDDGKGDDGKGSFRARADNGAPNSTGVSGHVSHTSNDGSGLTQGGGGMHSETIEGQIFQDEGLASHARNIDISSAQVLACIGN